MQSSEQSSKLWSPMITMNAVNQICDFADILTIPLKSNVINFCLFHASLSNIFLLSSVSPTA